MEENVINIECEKESGRWDCDLRINPQDGRQYTKTIEDIDEVNIRSLKQSTNVELDRGASVRRNNLDPLECEIFFPRAKKRLTCHEQD